MTTLVALANQPFDDAAPAVLIAMAVAALLDMGIIWVLRSEWEFPSGALLTGLIIGVILRPQEPTSVVVAVSVIAIVSKHVLRTRWSNIFNPAALALVASSFLFSTGQSWWGSMPDFGPLGIIVMCATGLFIADRINKLPLVVVFLGAYFALFTVASFLGKPIDVAEVFRTPDLQATLFFAFFMVDDPPTCPARYEDQIPFGLIVAVASFRHLHRRRRGVLLARRIARRKRLGVRPPAVRRDAARASGLTRKALLRLRDWRIGLVRAALNALRRSRIPERRGRRIQLRSR